MLTAMALKSADPCLGRRVNLTTNHQLPNTNSNHQPPTISLQPSATTNSEPQVYNQIRPSTTNYHYVQLFLQGTSGGRGTWALKAAHGRLQPLTASRGCSRLTKLDVDICAVLLHRCGTMPQNVANSKYTCCPKILQARENKHDQIPLRLRRRIWKIPCQ